MPQVLPIIQGIGAVGGILGGFGGTNTANQLGSQAMQNWQAASNVYQPTQTGAADISAWNAMNAPSPGRDAIANLLAELTTPGGKTGGAITEAVRSSMADRGLSTSPYGALMESQALIPTLNQAIGSTAGELQGMDQQKIQDLMSYLTTGIGAGATKGGIQAGIGGQQYGAAQQIGANAGTALSGGLSDLAKILGSSGGGNIVGGNRGTMRGNF